MPASSPQWCAGCGRTVHHRLAYGRCSNCYSKELDEYGPRQADPQMLAWNQTSPKLALAQVADPWRTDAACNGMNPDLFFPELGEDARPAKEVCRGCPVRERCLEYAMANRETHGVWGGRSEKERRRLRRQRSQVAA
jgi:WhiB family redox-sensing transcriptional regulator